MDSIILSMKCADIVHAYILYNKKLTHDLGYVSLSENLLLSFVLKVYGVDDLYQLQLIFSICPSICYSSLLT